MISVANILSQICSQAAANLCPNCLFQVIGTSLEQAVNNLKQALWYYQTCYKIVLTRRMTILLQLCVISL